MSKEGARLARWRDDHRLTKTATIKPGQMREPGLRWATRYRNLEHIRDLKKSFKTAGKINERMGVVVCDNATYHNFEMYKKNPTDTKLKQSMSIPELAKVGLMAFAGDHSRVATLELAQAYPKCNTFSQIYTVEVLIVPETPEAFELLRILSNQDNMLCKMQLATSYGEVVEQNHRFQAALVEDWAPEPVPRSAYTTLKEGLVTARVCTSVSSAQNVFMLAKHQGECWDLILQILKGETQPLPNKKKPQGKPTSAYPFAEMSTLPEETVCKYLKKVIEGEWSYGSLRLNCKMWKSRRKVKDAIKDHLILNTGIVDEHEGEDVTWKHVTQKYPALALKSFLQPWYSYCSKIPVKQSMPSSFHTAVSGHVRVFQTMEVLLIV